MDKGYLCGFSPYTVLLHTKSDLGPNPSPLQAAGLPRRPAASLNAGDSNERGMGGPSAGGEGSAGIVVLGLELCYQDKYGYERLLKDHLEELVADMDRKVVEYAAPGQLGVRFRRPRSASRLRTRPRC